MEEDTQGIRILSEVVEINKDEKGLVGISIGGGHPYCPCVYVVQIFENSPVDKDGRIKAGDELAAVNGRSVKGDKKSNVAQLIQSSPDPVKLTINKLDVDVSKGKTMDIVLKKIKHKMVEFMETDTADALGLSRAILCNDPLLKKMNVLERNTNLYQTLVNSLNDIVYSVEKMSEQQKVFGDIFCEIGAHEKQGNASEVFTEFGDAHRLLDRRQQEALKDIKPFISDLTTYIEKAVPDTQLTVKKYLDVKYEYLSYCLKLKEMDDEEVEFHSLGDPLYRVETGNYEYRVMLRCRQETRDKFVRMRSDVMVKIELLDQKHVRDLAMQLGRYARVMKSCQADCQSILEKTAVTPLEIDISQMTVSKKDNVEEEEVETGEDVAAEQSNNELILIDTDVDQDRANDNPNPLEDEMNLIDIG